MSRMKGKSFHNSEARGELSTALVDLLARRPELRDVGIAGYLVDSALNDDATLRRWSPARVQGQVLAVMVMRHLNRPIDMDVMTGKAGVA